MSDNEVSMSSELEGEFAPESVRDEGDLSAHSVDLTDWFSSGVTETGSFDLGLVAATSFGSLLDMLPVPILLIDSTYRVVFINQACCKIGPDGEQLQGVPFTTLVPRPRNAEKALWLLRKVFASRKPQVADGVLEIAARKIWGRLHFSSIRIGRERFVLLVVEDLTGERTRLLLNQRDENLGRKTREELEKLVSKLTSELSAVGQKREWELKRHEDAQKALTAEKELFEALCESSPEAIGIVDANHMLRFVSHRFRELFEYASADVPDLVDWFQRLSPGSAADGETVSRQLAVLGLENQARPLIWRCKDGAEKPIHLRAVPVTGDRLLVICREHLASSSGVAV